MAPDGNLNTAFILSLIAGILIILGSASMMGSFYMPMWGMMGGFGMMNGFGYGTGMFYGFNLIGIIFGLVVLLGAYMLYNKPSESTTWGLIILILSLLSFFGGGGFFFGAILGMIGGAVAYTSKPAVRRTRQR